ncbi:membrane anchor subunit of succinate dehydrogenase, Sdh4 [Pleosporales sp. CAS-2024a]
MAALLRPTLARHAAHAHARAPAIAATAFPFRPHLRPPIAAFHATHRAQILPPLPQKIVGTANDPVPVPAPDYTHGSYHWSFERLVSAGLVPLTLAPFAAGSLNPVTDSVLCALLVVHSHIGFEACITDYFPKKRIPKIRAAANWALRIATLTLGVALYSFETNDVGITEAVKRLWQA